MPRGEKKRALGSVKRNVMCGCGWSCSSNPDRIYKIISLHAKKCSCIDIEQFKDLPNTSIYSNEVYESTSKHTNIKGLCFRDGVTAPINVKKSHMDDQILSFLK